MIVGDFDFRGRTAIVTGAAHGIGRSICRELSARGAVVWTADVLPEDLKATEMACVDRGGRCEMRVLDVTREHAMPLP